MSFDLIKSSSNDQYYQSWCANTNACEKLSVYKCFKLDLCIVNYLQYDFNTNILTELRSGSLKL